MAGTMKGRILDLNSVFEGVGMRAAGIISDEELMDVEDNACPGCGSCSGMFTANTMNCMMEAPGQLTGTAPYRQYMRARLARTQDGRHGLIEKHQAWDTRPGKLLKRPCSGSGTRRFHEHLSPPSCHSMGCGPEAAA